MQCGVTAITGSTDTNRERAITSTANVHVYNYAAFSQQPAVHLTEDECQKPYPVHADIKLLER